MWALPTLLIEGFTDFLKVMADGFFVGFSFEVTLHHMNGPSVITDGLLDFLEEGAEAVLVEVE